MIVTFIGHRKLQNNCDFHIQLKEIILALIDHRNADTFLFGSRSDFDDLCLEIVTEKKNDHSFNGFMSERRTHTLTRITKTIYSRHMTLPISRITSSMQGKHLMSNAISI